MDESIHINLFYKSKDLRRIIVQNKEIYLEIKLKEINREIMKLNIKRRQLYKKLNSFKKTNEQILRKETKKDQAIIESIYLLKSNPNKLFTSKEICNYLKSEINFNTDSFAGIYRRLQHFESNIVQIRRGFYMYKN
jgi:transcription initiation factor TFIIIB Brf1 subunit/transcription initiation factor TFIIB